jgi:hypothetical protein
VGIRTETLRRRSDSQGAGLLGHVDYRLARNAVVRDVHLGRVPRHEVCDAHPELLRAARNVGEVTPEDCPICSAAKIVEVSFVFGPRMPKGGRCLTSPAELVALARRAARLRCYVVEVCPECSWNHLLRLVPLGRGDGDPTPV